MSEFPAVIALSSLNGTVGFRIDGVASSDQVGRSVSSAGDVNGDGFDDVVVSARFADPNGLNSAGSSYVVFGKAGGFAPTFALSSLNGGNGFRIDGAAASDYSGFSASSAGDVNGDGFDDLVVGAYGADPNGLSNAGSSYVVFGRAGGFAAAFTVSGLNGSNGFRIDGVAADDRSGIAVSSAGDLNGDGFDDLIVGARGADPNGLAGAGSSYVVFGKTGGFGASLSLSSLNGSNGFRIDGVAASDGSGLSVSSAGDVNGDGIDDIVVGAGYAAPNGTNGAGSSYVVFGRAGGFGPSLSLASLDGSNGFRIDGTATYDYSGLSVSDAGDVNGDGFGDLIVGARYADPGGKSSAGSSYVVFGKAGGFGATLALASLNGNNGFRIDGLASGDLSGFSVSSAGDVNGDGFDDLIVGAQSADPNGLSSAGSSYVVFGRAGGFDTSLDLSSLDGTAGFRIDGAAANESSGFSVSAAGDVNGDGFDDIVVGAVSASPNGVASAGASYVIFGRAPDAAVGRIGGNGANTIRGGAFDDTLDGLGGNDSLFGGAGRDVLRGGTGKDRLDGGSGADFMQGDDGDDTYVVDSVDDLLREFANQGTDTVLASITYTLGANVERLTLLGSAAINGTGNAAANTLTGNGGANILDGGAGADAMAGRGGSDTYLVDNAGDRVFEGVGDGTDKVLSSVSYTLAAGQEIESLQLLSSTGSAALNLTGNAFGQTLVGNNGGNVLDGGAGNDVLIGRGGDDTYLVDSGGDQVVEAARGGVDRVLATTHYTLAAGQEIEALQLLSSTGAAKFNLTGNEFAQTLVGNRGANVLDGRLGSDVLTGGQGADTFVFATALGASNVDRVADFATEDTIRLSKAVFTALAAGPLAEGAFKNISTGKVDADDRILYKQATGELFYDADALGSGSAVKFAVLDNHAALTAADFLIV